MRRSEEGVGGLELELVGSLRDELGAEVVVLGPLDVVVESSVAGRARIVTTVFAIAQPNALYPAYGSSSTAYVYVAQ